MPTRTPSTSMISGAPPRVVAPPPTRAARPTSRAAIVSSTVSGPASPAWLLATSSTSNPAPASNAAPAGSASSANSPVRCGALGERRLEVAERQVGVDQHRAQPFEHRGGIAGDDGRHAAAEHQVADEDQSSGLADIGPRVTREPCSADRRGAPDGVLTGASDGQRDRRHPLRRRRQARAAGQQRPQPAMAIPPACIRPRRPERVERPRSWSTPTHGTMTSMTRLGYQIPNFTYPDTAPDQIFGKVVAQAQGGRGGRVRPGAVDGPLLPTARVGGTDEPMLECYTMLSALAQHTRPCACRRWSPATRIGTRRCWRSRSPRSTTCRVGGRRWRSEPAGSSSNTTRSATSSARSPTASRSSRRRSRSSSRC